MLGLDVASSEEGLRLDYFLSSLELAFIITRTKTMIKKSRATTIRRSAKAALLFPSQISLNSKRHI